MKFLLDCLIGIYAVSLLVTTNVLSNKKVWEFSWSLYLVLACHILHSKVKGSLVCIEGRDNGFLTVLF